MTMTKPDFIPDVPVILALPRYEDIEAFMIMGRHNGKSSVRLPGEKTYLNSATIVACDDGAKWEYQFKSPELSNRQGGFQQDTLLEALKEAGAALEKCGGGKITVVWFTPPDDEQPSKDPGANEVIFTPCGEGWRYWLLDRNQKMFIGFLPSIAEAMTKARKFIVECEYRVIFETEEEPVQ